MGILADEYRKTRGKDEPSEARTPFAFRTGIDLLDYKNGKMVKVLNGKSYLSLGIDEGTYIMIIGRSGGGKTTLALQLAYNIVKDYPDGEIYHDDVEAATDDTRMMMLTKWSPEELENRYIHRNEGITSEAFFSNLDRIYRLKMQLKDRLTVETDKLDARTGKPITILQPTVYVLDSLAVLVPEEFSEEEKVSGSMSATAVAKHNSMMFQRILPKLKKANIILIVI